MTLNPNKINRPSKKGLKSETAVIVGNDRFGEVEAQPKVSVTVRSSFCEAYIYSGSFLKPILKWMCNRSEGNNHTCAYANGVGAQSIACVLSLYSSGKQVRIPQSRKEKIEAELKLLEWHKMANAAAIKVVYIVTLPLVKRLSSVCFLNSTTGRFVTNQKYTR